MRTLIYRDGKFQLSHSALHVLQMCEKRFYFDFLLGIKPKRIVPTDPRSMGNVFHRLKQFWLESASFTEEARRLIKEDPGMSPQAVATISACEYMTRLAGDPPFVSNYNVMHESRLDYPIEGTQYNLTGYSDAVIETDAPFTWGDQEMDAGRYLYECKSTSRFDSRALDLLQVDSQTQLYAELMEQQGNRVDGILYEQTLKPAVEFELPEGEKEYEERVEEMKQKAELGMLGARLRLKAGETQDDFIKRRIDKGREEVSKLFRKTGDTQESFRNRVVKFYETREAKGQPNVLRFAVGVNTNAGGDRLEAAAEMAFRLKDRIGETVSHVDHDHWIANVGRATCFSYNRPCDFMSLCTNNYDTEILNEDFELKDAKDRLNYNYESEAPF